MAFGKTVKKKNSLTVLAALHSPQICQCGTVLRCICCSGKMPSTFLKEARLIFDNTKNFCPVSPETGGLCLLGLFAMFMSAELFGTEWNNAGGIFLNA